MTIPKPTIPPLVARLLPPAQLVHTLRNYGVYAEVVERLYQTAAAMPRLGDTELSANLPFFLHYFTGVADYFISAFDGDDTMFGAVQFNTFSVADVGYRKFSLANLKSNAFLELDFGWNKN